LTLRAVALNGVCKRITRNTRTANNPVASVTGGCDLIDARSTRDRGRIGTIATGCTRCTRGAVQPVTGVTGGRDLIGAIGTRDCGHVGTGANGSTGLAHRTSVQPVTGVTGVNTPVKSIQVHHTCRTHVISASDVVVGNGGQRVRGTCGA